MSETRYLFGKYPVSIVDCKDIINDDCDSNCLRVKLLEDFSVTVMARDVDDNMQLCDKPIKLQYHKGQEACFSAFKVWKKQRVKCAQNDGEKK